MKLYKNDSFSEYELKNKRASYARIVDMLVGDIVLCNNLPEIDPSIWDNAEFDLDDEIYQYYLCNLNDYDKKIAQECGLLFTYSDLLDLDVLCVDHYGTSWDYVLTDCEITDNIEEI